MFPVFVVVTKLKIKLFFSADSEKHKISAELRSKQS